MIVFGAVLVLGAVLGGTLQEEYGLFVDRRFVMFLDTCFIAGILFVVVGLARFCQQNP